MGSSSDNDYLWETDKKFGKYFLINSNEEAQENSESAFDYFIEKYSEIDQKKSFNIFTDLDENQNQNFTEIRPTGLDTEIQITDSNKIKFTKLNFTELKMETDKKLLGRKRKDDKRVAKHTKMDDDNKMRKIKAYFMKFVHQKINGSLSLSRHEFQPISKELNQNLKKDFNISLMQKTLKEIYETYPINNRHSEYTKNKNINIKLIKDIYDKNTEPEVIKILNMKYIDMLKIFRMTYLSKFSDDIYKVLIEKNQETVENAKKYVDELKELLFNYENWFLQKSGRNRKK